MMLQLPGSHPQGEMDLICISPNDWSPQSQLKILIKDWPLSLNNQQLSAPATCSANCFMAKEQYKQIIKSIRKFAHVPKPSPRDCLIDCFIFLNLICACLYNCALGNCYFSVKNPNQSSLFSSFHHSNRIQCLGWSSPNYQEKQSFSVFNATLGRS